MKNFPKLALSHLSSLNSSRIITECDFKQREINRHSGVQPVYEKAQLIHRGRQRVVDEQGCWIVFN
jgi:hypothetical protein